MQVHIDKVESYDPVRVRAFLDTTLRPAIAAAPEARRILIKPNLLGAFAPEKAVTTHPVIVEQAILLLQEMGREVSVGDGPGGSAPYGEVLRVTGMRDVIERTGARLADFKRGGMREVESDGVDLVVTEAFYECDAVVNLCKYKTHSLMLYTGAVKNLYGLIPGLRKSLYHKDYPRPEDFVKVLVALYRIALPKLAYHVLDGVIGMEGEGPSGGTPRNFGVMMASASAASLDTVAARMMGFEPRRIPYIIGALHHEGVLPSHITVPDEWKHYRFDNVDTRTVRMRNMLAGNAPAFVRALVRKLFDLYPSFTSDCKRCGICVQSCPVQALRLDDGADRPVLDKQACIRCMCCHEMCPHHAVMVEKSWLAGRFVRR